MNKNFGMVLVLVIASIVMMIDGVTSGLWVLVLLWTPYLLGRFLAVRHSIPDPRDYYGLPFTNIPERIDRYHLPVLRETPDDNEAMRFVAHFGSSLLKKIQSAGSEYDVTTYVQTMVQSMRENINARYNDELQARIRMVGVEAMLGVVIAAIAFVSTDPDHVFVFGETLFAANPGVLAPFAVAFVVLGRVFHESLERQFRSARAHELQWVKYINQRVNDEVMIRLNMPIRYAIDDKPLEVTQRALVQTCERAERILENVERVGPGLEELSRHMDAALDFVRHISRFGSGESVRNVPSSPRSPEKRGPGIAAPQLSDDD